MIRNAFDLCFHKVSGGDASFMERFCDLLSERRLFVPTMPLQRGKPGQASANFQFMLIPRKSMFVVPVFAYEAMPKFWLSKVQINSNCIALRGADLAARIDENISVVLNLGQLEVIDLPSHALEKMAAKQSTPETQIDEFDELELEEMKKVVTVSIKKRPIVTLLDLESGETNNDPGQQPQL